MTGFDEKRARLGEFQGDRVLLREALQDALNPLVPVDGNFDRFAFDAADVGADHALAVDEHITQFILCQHGVDLLLHASPEYLRDILGAGRCPDGVCDARCLIGKDDHSHYR